MTSTTSDSAPTVLISGASSGIGRAATAALAAAGWTVYAAGRNLERLPSGRGTGAGCIIPIALDVTRPDSVAQALHEMRTTLNGRTLDALVNNAGIGRLAPMQVVDDDDLRAVFDVNVFGAVSLTQQALPLMATGGRIVFIGSVGDRITMPFGGPLTSSKWAIASIAEAFRLELRGVGIGVVLVEPGSIHTAAVDKVESQAAELAERIRAHDASLAARFERATATAVANERSGSEPEVVGRVLVRVLSVRRPRTRYLVGRHARLLAALGRLPDPAFDALRLRLSDQTSTEKAAS
ncbi:SDR family NAD(P)-dependent oxidoreductase [Williamsia sterculiae]|uniref:NADP-dependent 3-hydroxy acid dehydrogenase YdfG n=1 Tax=Williamsia sterculiae TaxID=1344003 RepID=A0A1N7EQ47_9NOCA|nr:SDR family NAD(P)-dependent oxidoreductase [Williamsia sterculiae]SIR90218.1 NADP-dependent 3-hydroxy acid dehydrogenase YdfG [Williamsia sterculiae]